MKKKENIFLTAIIILSLLLIITSALYDFNKEQQKKLFIAEVKYILELIGERRVMTTNFDVGMINEKNIGDILNISNRNYQKVSIIMNAEKVHITVVGKNQWEGFTACGTIDGMFIVEKEISCV